MSRLDSRSREVWTKLVLFGAPRTGVKEVLEGVSNHYAHTDVHLKEAGEAGVIRTEVIWPNPLPNDWHLRMRLFGISGQPDFNALNELLLSEVDGVVFVADVSNEETLRKAVEALKLMVFNLQRLKYDLQKLPIVLHYHRAEAHQMFRPELMDQFLGIPVGSVPRFVTNSGDGPMEMSVAVDYLTGVIHAGVVKELETGEGGA